MIKDERADRKAYPRLLAPVYFSFTKAWLPPFLQRRGEPMDGATGGMRVYTDEEPKPGARCRLEIFLPDGSSVVCRTEIAWVEPLQGGPARFDVGLRLTAIHPLDRMRLSAVLEHP
jgi:hypothetical protein